MLGPTEYSCQYNQCNTSVLVCLQLHTIGKHQNVSIIHMHFF